MGTCGCAVEVVGATDGAALADAVGLAGVCVAAAGGVAGTTAGAVVACSAGRSTTGVGGTSTDVVSISIESDVAASSLSLLPRNFLQQPRELTPRAIETHAVAAATITCFMALMLPPIDACSNGFVTCVATLTEWRIGIRLCLGRGDGKAVAGKNRPVFVCG